MIDRNNQCEMTDRITNFYSISTGLKTWLCSAIVRLRPLLRSISDERGFFRRVTPEPEEEEEKWSRLITAVAVG